MTPAEEGILAAKTDAKMFEFLTRAFTTSVTQDDMKYVRFTHPTTKTVTFFDVGGMLGHSAATMSLKKAEEQTGLSWQEISDWLVEAGAKCI